MKLLETYHLVKEYATGANHVFALNDVSISIGEGEFVAIMGQSGSGKSTFMNLIGCLDIPTSGDYYLGGEKVSDMDGDELAMIRNQQIGFVFQQFNLLPRTSALENVELPLLYAGVDAAERKERALARLGEVGLGERVHHTPAELSGGQQQRVAIARGLVNNPSLILADEPTGALDSRTSIEIMALMQKLSRTGMTIVIVTHEPEIAAFASRIITFRDGRVLSDDPNTPNDALKELEKYPPAGAKK
ncbi:MAG: ABC transporter ATP-binding protein [Burkholderiaceae bacterium]|jgi:putative ABC transport system ATP-binding protein|nr:ABC transporter ATP-binding protein [Burkholderiaceae bacterium]